MRVLFEFLKWGCAQPPNGDENSASGRYASVGFANSEYHQLFEQENEERPSDQRTHDDG